jgi:hypothetical protein
MPETDYDDRLTGHDTVDSLMDAAEAIAEELAIDHHDRCYGDTSCAMCADDTPLSGAVGGWLGMKSDFDDFCEAVRERVQRIDPSDEAFWVDGELSGTYLEGFDEAAVDPADCEVCNMDDEYVDCGHIRFGEECPVD